MSIEGDKMGTIEEEYQELVNFIIGMRMLIKAGTSFDTVKKGIMGIKLFTLDELMRDSPPFKLWADTVMHDLKVKGQMHDTIMRLKKELKEARRAKENNNGNDTRSKGKEKSSILP